MSDTAPPHIVVLPGGGYDHHADHEGEPVARWLRSLGLGASAFLYPVKAHHPAPHDAIGDEIERLRSTGIDRVGVLGFSAGGHAAGLAATRAATRSRRPDLAVLCYPVVSMILPGHRGSVDNLLGEAASDELRESVSLERVVDAACPPVFVWHTADDPAVPVSPVYRLAEALSRNGVDHSVHVYPHGPHGLGLAIGSGEPSAWTAELHGWLHGLGWAQAPEA